MTESNDDRAAIFAVCLDSSSGAQQAVGTDADFVLFA